MFKNIIKLYNKINKTFSIGSGELTNESLKMLGRI